MATWIKTLNFSAWYHNDDIGIKQKANLAKAALEKLAKTPGKQWGDDFDLLDAIDQFAEAEDVESFDDGMRTLYDWADKERVWVNTTK